MINKCYLEYADKLSTMCKGNYMQGLIEHTYTMNTGYKNVMIQLRGLYTTKGYSRYRTSS